MQGRRRSKPTTRARDAVMARHSALRYQAAVQVQPEAFGRSGSL
jgi:hypothetical protein